MASGTVALLIVAALSRCALESEHVPAATKRGPNYPALFTPAA